MSAHAWGWDEQWESRARGRPAARVVSEHKGYLELESPAGQRHLATVSGRLLHEADDARQLPAVGDWVIYGTPDDDGRVQVSEVLTRRSALIRRAAGRDEEPQVVAANVDLVLVVTGLDGDLNPRRLERYLAAVAGSGARVAVVMTKLDLVDQDEVSRAVDEVEALSPGISVVPVSNLTGDGHDELSSLIAPGDTLVLVGSSGTGKSTLANALAGDELQLTAEVRQDGRGRHTTTRRELIGLPRGVVLIDTPGMRELGLWGDEVDLDQAFPEVAEAARACRFGDCAHLSEPGCGVTAAAEVGEIAPARLASYLRLAEELELQQQALEDRRRRRR